MLRLLSVVVLTGIIASCATAPDTSSARHDQDATKQCKEFAELGALIMNARQKGTPKETVLQKIEDGEVVEVNEAIVDEPGKVNDDPEGEAWFFKLKVSDAGPLDDYMDEAAYKAFIG